MPVSWMEMVFIGLVGLWAVREEVKWHKRFSYLLREGFSRPEAWALMRDGRH